MTLYAASRSLSISEAAAKLNVKPRTIRYNLENGFLPYTQTDGESRIDENAFDGASLWISAAEAARFLGVERERIRQLSIEEGKLPYRKDGRFVYVSMRHVERRKEEASSIHQRGTVDRSQYIERKIVHTPQLPKETAPNSKEELLLRLIEDVDLRFGAFSNIPDDVLKAYPLDESIVCVGKRVTGRGHSKLYTFWQEQ